MVYSMVLEALQLFSMRILFETIRAMTILIQMNSLGVLILDIYVL